MYLGSLCSVHFWPFFPGLGSRVILCTLLIIFVRLKEHWVWSVQCRHFGTSHFRSFLPKAAQSDSDSPLLWLLPLRFFSSHPPTCAQHQLYNPKISDLRLNFSSFLLTIASHNVTSLAFTLELIIPAGLFSFSGLISRSVYSLTCC